MLSSFSFCPERPTYPYLVASISSSSGADLPSEQFHASLLASALVSAKTLTPPTPPTPVESPGQGLEIPKVTTRNLSI